MSTGLIRAGRRLCLLAAFAALLTLAGADGVSGRTFANPTAVTIAGSLQSELGCPGDWDPACATTHLTYDASDDVWQGTFSVPAGSYDYKAALNDSFTENYGLHAAPGGANIPLSLAAPASVKFFYDHKTHWVTDSVDSIVAVAPGSFQSELGCPGDWQPDCLRSWLQDPDGDGVYTLTTTSIPAGDYEAKVAIGESWTENYGAGGTPNGSNIPFTVPSNGTPVTFSYNAATHVLTISSAPLRVGVISFSARAGRSGVVLRWRTEQDVATLGFNIFRLQRGHRARINRSLIVARRGSLLDARAPAAGTLRYVLEAVSVGGRRSVVAAATVRAGSDRSS